MRRAITHGEAITLRFLATGERRCLVEPLMNLVTFIPVLQKAIIVCTLSSVHFVMTEKFLYFAYGSNLLRQRLLLNNPSAVFKCVAKLQNYKLVFVMKPNATRPTLWRGGVASITPSSASHVCGVVWEMDCKDRTSLDRQEGNYVGYNVTVQDENDHEHTCRTYEFKGAIIERPSPQYKDIILRGARQNGLPPYYIGALEQVEDNAFVGHIQVYENALKLIKSKDRL